ncbi:hypothetical protein BO94DRAFT_208750 [Aspergillus sclerotioniger CBS 115572]|uniref:Ubiquitin 3 binding protein But2 C-terminal domain-containing protein n=1 Tax=Aspergillus sclerotioniger CBS 115572 TaxID=1450535 RepID=A0A317VP29_9EURO|nr:hypothetical protein BO94DRAFT_208750 [Aspergillus sclerotioniger CBS 115572]PWY76096.1 hypothetical protein BO94DRAFT_208750 [Aspergillus sclerotioniger CBS 115572]
MPTAFFKTLLHSPPLLTPNSTHRMKISTPITALAMLATMTIASPTSVDLAARACTTISPSIIDVLDSANPDSPSPGQHFSLARFATEHTKISALTFTGIPNDATGCMLAIDIPVLTHPIAQGANQADIWSTDPWDSTSLPTWNNQPKRREMVETYQFPNTQTSSPTHTILASNTFSSTLSWVALLSTWQTTLGTVDFLNSISGGNPIGFSLVYNC